MTIGKMYRVISQVQSFNKSSCIRLETINMIKLHKQVLVTGLIVLLVGVVVALIFLFVPNSSDEQSTVEEIHVLDEVPLIDGHNDFPYTLYELEKNEINNFEFDSDLKLNPKWNVMKNSHTDLLRLRKGKVGGQFWVAFVGCDNNYKDAVERTVEQIDVIKRLIEKYPKDLKYVTTADGIMEAFKEKKIASMIEVEGGHSIDSRLAVLRLFYELGVRCMTLTHSCNLPWADASPIDDTNDVKKNLTEWGKKVVWEMNRLGMIADISHVSEGVMESVLDNSKAPVIFSHSSVYKIHNHNRNVKDHVLLKLKEKNGLIMINFFTFFIGGESIDRVIEHINYVRDLIGADHVGLGGDYNGMDGAPKGLDDVSKYPDLFNKLAESGHGYEPWSREDLKKLAGLNLIRVFKDVEKVRDELKNDDPIEDFIPHEAINIPDIKTCRTDVDFYKDGNQKMFQDILCE